MINVGETITVNTRRQSLGVIQVFRNADGGRGINFSGKKSYKCVRFNVISVNYEGVQFPEKREI